MKKLLPVLAALCLSALSLGTALAHEPRDIEDYNLVVGFLNEPAFEGVLNGVSLRVTKVASHEHEHDEDASAPQAMEHEAHGDHDHDSMSHEPINSEVPVSVQLMTEIADDGGVNIHLMTENWRWTPQNVNMENSPGEGHAHVYVDGEKIGRIYGPYYHLGGLEAGERQVRVTLNANTHNELLYDGKLVEAAAVVSVPESGRRMTADMHHHESIDAQGAMSLHVMAHSDGMGSHSLQVMPHGFTFSPRNVDGEHVPGEGYGIVSINGEERSRIYTEWLELPALDAGMHTIEVKLVSNDHIPYTWGGDPVHASATVQVESEDGSDAMADAADSDHDDHDHADDLIVGVEGLENTLQVEVTHVPSGTKRLMPLYAVFEAPGYYKADFIPTATGQYIFHFLGSIEGMQLDERFESGVGRFDDVQPATAIQFPDSAASMREIEAALRGALDSAQQAQDTALALESAANSAQSSASTASTLAIAGIAVGVIGIVIGGIGAAAVLRRKS